MIKISELVLYKHSFEASKVVDKPQRLKLTFVYALVLILILLLDMQYWWCCAINIIL